MQAPRSVAVPGSFNNPVPNTPAELARVPIAQPLKTLEEVVLFARALAYANLLPDSLQDKRTGQIRVADVIVLLAMGAELDLSPMQSVHGIYVVKGRPMLSAQLWGTRIRKFGHRLTLHQESNANGRPVSATAVITRGDDGTVHEESFSIWDARNAGLCQVNEATGEVMSRSSSGQKQPWEQYTKTMLRNRAISHCARYACPEVIYGTMGIRGEEYDELSDEDGFGDDRFVAGRSIEGTPQQADALADELMALAGRMTGQPGREEREEREEQDKAALGTILKGIKDRTEALPVDPERGPIRTCLICNWRGYTSEHAEEYGPDDHEPSWMDEPED